MEYQYLFDLNDEKNWINPKKLFRSDGTISEDIHFIHFSLGPESLFRVTDSVLYPSEMGEIEDCYHHSHHVGFEYFYWLTGTQDYYVNNKKTVLNEPGFFTLVQPYERHGIVFRSPCRKVGFFHHMPLSAEDNASSALLGHYKPNARSSPDFPRGDGDSTSVALPLPDTYGCEPPTEYVELPCEQMSNVKHISRPMAEFHFDGVTMKMIISRWENWGVLEVWGAEMEKGFYAEWNTFPTMTEMYFIADGEVKFKVYDEEFIAHKECIVKIPRYAEHSIEVLSDTVMYDVAAKTFWFDYLMDLFSIKKNDPDRYNDKAAMAALKNKYGCQIKTIGRR